MNENRENHNALLLAARTAALLALAVPVVGCQGLGSPSQQELDSEASRGATTMGQTGPTGPTGPTGAGSAASTTSSTAGPDESGTGTKGTKVDTDSGDTKGDTDSDDTNPGDTEEGHDSGDTDTIDPETPQYIVDLGPLEVLPVDVVSNGNATMLDAIPPEWQVAGPGTATSGTVGADGRDVVASWSGGTMDPDGRQYYFNGGGHGNSANNGIYKYDFIGESMPTGWTAHDGPSAISNTDVASGQWADGRWQSVHSYAGTVFANGWLYRFGGSTFSGSGGCTRGWFRVDLAENTYFESTDGNFTRTNWCGHIAVHDPSANKIIQYAAQGGTYGVFDIASSTFDVKQGGGASSPELSGLGESTGAYDPTRQQLLVMGGNASGIRVFEFDGETSALTETNPRVSVSGDTSLITSAFAPAITYDSDRDCFWAMDISSEQPSNQQYLWQISPDNFEFTRHSFVANPIDQTSAGASWGQQPRGGYGKLMVLRAWGALAAFNKVDGPMYIIKKPAG